MGFFIRAAAVTAVAVGTMVYMKSKKVLRTLSKKESDRIAEGDVLEAEFVEVERPKDEKPKAKEEPK